MLLSIPSIYWHSTVACIFFQRKSEACTFFPPSIPSKLDLDIIAPSIPSGYHPLYVYFSAFHAVHSSFRAPSSDRSNLSNFQFGVRSTHVYYIKIFLFPQ